MLSPASASLFVLSLVASAVAAPLHKRDYEFQYEYFEVVENSNWSYQGCVMSMTGLWPRTFPFVNGDNTPSRCFAACTAAGSTLCGMSDSAACYGNDPTAEYAESFQRQILYGLKKDPMCLIAACYDAPTLACGTATSMLIYGPPAVPSSVSSTDPSSTASTATSTSTADSEPTPSPAAPVESSATSIEPSATSVVESSATTVASDITTSTATSTISSTTTISSAVSTPTASSVSNNADWTYSGCWTDNVGSRTLVNGLGSTDWTASNCLALASAAGYQYAGVEYGGEWGANELTTGTQQDDSKCDMTCNNNALEICGGANAISVYLTTKPASSSSSAASAASSTATSTTAAATPTSTLLSKLSSETWSYSGCFEDSIGARSLPHGISTSPWTTDTCIAAAEAAGYSVAGVEYGGEWASNSISANPLDASSCNMQCNDLKGQSCGGNNALDVYILRSSTKYTNDDWTYSGCFEDSIAVRSLPNLLSAKAWSAESCLAAAVDAGFSVAAVEYGGEWAGNAITATKLAASSCDMRCNDATGYTCGGSNALDVYTYSGVLPSVSSTTPTATETTTSTTDAPVTSSTSTSTTTPTTTTTTSSPAEPTCDTVPAGNWCYLPGFACEKTCETGSVCRQVPDNWWYAGFKSSDQPGFKLCVAN